MTDILSAIGIAIFLVGFCAGIAAIVVYATDFFD